MEITLIEQKERKERSFKLILVFGMVSMFMMFAGLTSAFVVSKSRVDWTKNFEIPSAFYISTAVILGCSIAFQLAKRSIKANDTKKTSAFLLLAMFLGLLFVGFQFLGFNQIIVKGYYFTGQASNITTTFLYIITLMHLLHLAGGIISLLIILYKQLKNKYNAADYLGITLGAMYWHFLDFLWIFIFLFLIFFI